MMVGRLLSFSDGIFSGAMLNFQGVGHSPSFTTSTRGIRHNLKMLGHIRLLHFDGVSCHKFMVETEASGQIWQIQRNPTKYAKINTPVN